MNTLKKLSTLALIIVLMGTIMVGCNSKENVKIDEESAEVNDTQESSYVDDGYLVEAKWLSENVSDDTLLILDARGEEAYNKGHIQGAVAVTWPEFANVNGAPGDEGWGVLLDAETLSERLSSIGVDSDKTIVVYTDTQNGWGEDGRIVWMLRMAGIENSKILNGGWNYWNNNDYEISKEATSLTPSEFRIDKLNESLTISTEELHTNLSDLTILDSREQDEYEGAAKFGENRGGHLPNAILFTFNEVLNEDGTFKTGNELALLFDEAGLNKEDEIVTYCTAGIRSAHLQIALKMMGYENVSNYDASYYEWAANENLVVEGKFVVEDGYRYFTAEQLKNSIEKDVSFALVDIQIKEEFDAHHITGAIPTYSYPVKSDDEKAKLDEILARLNESNNKIVVVCPRGGGGAKRTVDYLLEKGINENRLFILENGQEGWPYNELVNK